jgi:hypothetical protein
MESGEGLFGERSRLVLGVLPGKFEKWCGNDGEVLDMLPEEVAEPHEGPNPFYVVRWSRLLDALQLGLAWFDSFWS